MTHAEACHAGFARAGLWHVIGELRRLQHFTRTGRWQPTPEAVPFWEGGDHHPTVDSPGEHLIAGGGASGANTPWEGFG